MLLKNQLGFRSSQKGLCELFFQDLVQTVCSFVFGPSPVRKFWLRSMNKDFE